MIIIFKTQLEGRLGVQSESQAELAIDSGQRKDKNYYYYYSFKTIFESQFGVRSESRTMFTIDPSQHKNKKWLLL
jgi:hypothetical protein